MRTVCVCNAEQLLGAVRLRPTPHIELALPTLDSAEARLWEQRINRILNSCGCDEGAAGFLVGLGVSLAAVLLGGPPSPPPGTTVSAVVAAAVGGTVVGKITGKLRARRRGRREALKLVARLAAPAAVPKIPAQRVGA